VPIQIFATAGFFSGIFYLVLVCLVVASTLRALKIFQNKDKIFVASLFSAWIAFQAQTIISIDNAGLTIWGWALGGILISLGFGHKAESDTIAITNAKKKLSEDLLSKSRIISSFITLIGVMICSLLYQGEKYLYDLTRYINYSSQNQSENFYLTLKKFDQSTFVEPAYRFRVANLMFQIGRIDEANSRVEELLKMNPNSFDYLFGLAQIKSDKKDWRSVSVIREKIIKIDPWNAENYLLLAKAYENLGESERAKWAYNKILSFAGDRPVAQEAKISLSKIT
jgi:tetratricopeptide (TPR) repeat protein